MPILAVVTAAALIEPSPASAHTHAPAAAAAANSARPTSPVIATTSSAAPAPIVIAAAPARASVAAVSTACLTNTHAQYVLVSITQEQAWMCSGTNQIFTSAVTTGEVDNGDGTPTGTWQVQGKQTDRYLTGPGYDDFVHFWVPFDGSIGFHDAPWQTMPYGTDDYLTAGSHGCVHLPAAAMTWLYSWIQVGATVTVEH